MPLYPYRCTQCSYQFEKVQKFNAEPETVCPKCGGALERPLTAPALQFKGAGWYINDYAPKAASGGAGKAAGDSAAAPASNETAPSAAPAAASSAPAGSSSGSE